MPLPQGDASDLGEELEPDDPEPDSSEPGSDHSDSDASSLPDDGMLPFGAVPKHRVARTKTPCLRKDGVSASAADLVLSHTAPVSEPHRASFRYYPNQSNALGRRSIQGVRFEDGGEVAWTYPRDMYDRTPIQSTQTRGSSLDLSMRRCHSFRGDETEADEAEDGDEDSFHSPLAIRVAKASAQSDYFGSSWSTRLQAGQVVGFDTSTRLQPLALSGMTLDESVTKVCQANLPQSSEDEHSSHSLPSPRSPRSPLELSVPSIRSFGALTTPALDPTDSSDSCNDLVENMTASFDGPSLLESEDKTPTPSPSLANASTMLEGYFASCALHLHSPLTISIPEHDKDARTTNDMAPTRNQLGLNTQNDKASPDLSPAERVSRWQSYHLGFDEVSTASNSTSHAESGFTSATTAYSLSDANCSPSSSDTEGTVSPSVHSPMTINPSSDPFPTLKLTPPSSTPTSTATSPSRTGTKRSVSTSPNPLCIRRQQSGLELSLSDTTVREPRSSPDDSAAPMVLISPPPPLKKKSKKCKTDKKRSSPPPVLSAFGDDGEGALGGF